MAGYRGAVRWEPTSPSRRADRAACHRGGCGWLFYVQHQFADTYWAKGKRWNAHDAALHRSSHYQLPAVIRWFTANIGMHHVQHLSSRIPFYRLPEVLRDHKGLVDVGRVTLRASVRGVFLALWDEEQGRLVSFKRLRSTRRSGADS